jgi:hypothetical protein
MEAYRTTVDKDSWLVLSTDADLFRYLQSPNAPGGAARSAKH